MTNLVWTEGARSDLIEIADYIARRDPNTAASFVSTLMDRTLVLIDQPRLGRMVPEFGDESIREIIHGNYRIVYRILDSAVFVLTVFEGHRLLAP